MSITFGFCFTFFLVLIDSTSNKKLNDRADEKDLTE
jgi:hypothetical protein